jgi:hypothetical protein
MARQQRVVETVTCDVCGKETENATTVVLGWGKEQWELDLCDEDNAKVSETFDGWIRGARKVRATRGRPSPRSPRDSGGPSNSRQSDWDYLESLGFKRHRGRKTAAEHEALENRPS